MNLSQTPGRHSIAASVSCSDEQLHLVEFGAEILKKAGFEFVYSSLKSEACYYKLGNRVGVLRIAAHRFGHRSEGRLLAFPVWSCLTFSEPRIKSAEKVFSMIDSAVGRYILYPYSRLSNINNKAHPVSFLFSNKE